MATFQKQWSFVLFCFLLGVQAKVATERKCEAAYKSNLNGAMACGHQCLLQSRMINGDNAFPGEWPWQAQFILDQSFFVCGGVLIHPQWVLTAAHCLATNRPTNYTVILGDFHFTRDEDSEQIFRVKRIFRRRDFNVSSPYDSDVSLVQLSHPAKLNNWVNTVSLPSKDAIPGAQCVMTGWGATNSSDFAYYLQKAVVPIVSTPECKTRLQNAPVKGLVNRDSRPWIVTDKMICAGNATVSACYGDSGGPLVCKNTAGQWEVQGLVSWGDPSCNPKNFFTVFTRVTKFNQWIKENMLNCS